MCNDIVVPNETGSQIIKEYYPEIAEKIHIIEHGYEFKNITTSEVLYSEKVRYKVEDIYKAGNFYKFRGWAFVNGLDKNIATDTYIEINTPEKKSGLIPTSKRIRADVSNVSGRVDSGFEAVIPKEYIGASDAKVTIVIITQDGKSYYSIDNYELPKLSKLPENDNINIAFIGGINKEKGGKEICKLVKEYSKNVNWFLFGNVGMEELKNLKQDNFLWYNAYNSNDLPQLFDLYNIDVVGILSIWPETFSYTLTESLLCGRPVIVSDIGALGNRVNKLQCGWCVGLDDIQKNFSSILKKLIYDKNILNEYKNNISQIHLDTLKDMAAAYEDLYQKNISDKANYEKADYKFLYKSYVDRHYSIDGEKKNKEDAKSDCFDLANEYRIVTNSLSYRAAKKFADMKIPGKMMLYKMVKRIIK